MSQKRTTTVSDVCQLRSHILALREMLVNTNEDIPESVYAYFNSIDKLFFTMSACHHIDKPYTDYPLPCDVLELQGIALIRYLATICIIDLIKRCTAMTDPAPELEGSLQGMELISSELRHIGFELLHYIKKKDRAV